MAKTSGGIRSKAGVKITGGFVGGDSIYKGKISNLSGLNTIKHADVYGEIKQGISRYHSVMGVMQRDIKLGDMASHVNGAHITVGGKSSQIVLNRKVFNLSKKEIIARVSNSYKSGWSTVTKKYVQHTITHELAHATWNSSLSGSNHKAAGKEIKALFNKWNNDTRKKGYGKYAKSNPNEFWAETVTKAIHGNSDKYTRKVKYIAKKYKL